MLHGYTQRNINMQAAQGQSTLIFDSNAEESNSIVYSNWNSILAAAREIPGLTEILIITGSTIPAGTYDMEDITLAGTGIQDPTTGLLFVYVAEGVVFQNLASIRNLSLRWDVAFNSFTYDDGDVHTINFIRSEINVNNSASTASIFEIGNGTNLYVRATNSSFITFDPDALIFNITGNANVNAGPLGAPVCGSGGNSWGGQFGLPAFVSVEAGSGMTLEIGAADEYFAANQTLPATNVNYVQNYEAATAADWAAPSPRTQRNAIDRIAAAVEGLLGGPIPL